VKQSIADLAIFGGDPEFAQPLHVGRPNIPDPDRLLARMREILDRRWLTNDGPQVRSFEQQVAARSGARHCVAVANGTLGLEIASRALELSGEVIVPALTFVATPHALRWQQIRPVFADVDPGSQQLDPEQIEALLSPQTTGVLPVHLWGMVGDVRRIIELARRHNLRVLFDGSHAFHATCHGEPIGALGDATVFSFHATKFINCFEGGAVTTDSAELAGRMRSLRNFGFSGYDQVDYLGINAKMSEANAAMGLSCLESLEDFVAINRRNFETYAAELAGESGIHLLLAPTDEQSNYQYVVGLVDAERSAIPRDELLEVLWSENIRARRYFYPGCHRMQPYATEQSIPSLPVTEQIVEQIIQFPTGTAMSEDEIRRVCRLVRFVLANGREVHNGLKQRHS
jgi:dTDP-4-amino-4,6-dideoxygalactose transaminase